MKSMKFVLLAFLMNSLVMAGFSQTQDSAVKKDKKIESDDRQEGLKRLTDHTHRWDFDLDDEALEARIEQAVDQAMKNVSLALKNLDIRIAPIEINIPNIDVKDLDIEIPDVDVDLEPMEVQIPDIDIDIDPIDIDADNFHRHDHWNSDEDKNEVVRDDDKSIQKDKDKEKDAKDKSWKNEKDKGKDKTKLKKIN